MRRRSSIGPCKVLDTKNQDKLVPKTIQVYKARPNICVERLRGYTMQ